MSQDEAPPEITEGEKIGHLVELAGYASMKYEVTQDPRVKAVLDAAIKQVQDANVLPDLLRVMFQNNQQAQRNPVNAYEAAEAKREESRAMWEGEMRQTILNNQKMAQQQQDAEQAAIQLLLQQLQEKAKQQ